MGGPRERFPSASRLRRPREFQRVARIGKRRTSEHFIVLLACRDPHTMADRPRLGVTVSRRVGGAVVRNRVKRAVREWFRRSQALMAPNVDLVVIARQGAAGLRVREICEELRGVLN
ncbi:MAG TPA: ribonuclease P protein component [Deltaproteobacteria bacterium]|nr:ribonuclease P protein component [Deltaproteobacteria bacterium]